MAPTIRARQNHDALFPNHVSTLAATDPELIELFDNFAFDEVLETSTLDARTRLMVQLAAIIASQAVREYRAMLAAALNVGVTPVAAKEIVYQAIPYVGLAKVFDFLHVTNEVLTERGVPLPLPNQSRTTRQNRPEVGLKIQEQIVGGEVVEQLYVSAPADQQHIQRFLSANLFRRLGRSRRDRHPHARAPDVQHARRTRRLRSAGQGTRSCQPPRWQ